MRSCCSFIVTFGTVVFFCCAVLNELKYSTLRSYFMLLITHYHTASLVPFQWP
jgi:hypothetical protein